MIRRHWQWLQQWSTAGPLALRTAGAAVAAWLVVWPLGGVADEYPYYAPLGAVVVMSATVSGSLLAATRAFSALCAGAALGIAIERADVFTPLGIGAVVLAGTLVGAHRWFDDLGQWVPVSALFILVLGAGQPWHFGAGYLGLTGLGALVGVVLSLLLPPLPWGEVQRAQNALRTALADQLERLADGLVEDPLPSPEEWAQRRLDVERQARAVHELLPGVMERRPINWRDRRLWSRRERLTQRGDTLAALALEIGDLADFVADREQAVEAALPAGESLRPAAAAALRDTAAVLADARRDVDAVALERAERSVTLLAAAIRERRIRTGEDLFAAGSLVVSLERQLAWMGSEDARAWNSTSAL